MYGDQYGEFICGYWGLKGWWTTSSSLGIVERTDARTRVKIPALEEGPPSTCHPRGWPFLTRSPILFELLLLRKMRKNLTVIGNCYVSWAFLLGTLQNYDGDGIWISEKQNNNFARASRFSCQFLCRPCTTKTWNGQILSLLENGNGGR